MNDLQQRVQTMTKEHRETCLRSALQEWLPPKVVTEVKRFLLETGTPDDLHPRAEKRIREHIETPAPKTSIAEKIRTKQPRRKKNATEQTRLPPDHREPTHEEKNAAWGHTIDGWEFETIGSEAQPGWKTCQPAVASELDALLLTWVAHLDAEMTTETRAEEQTLRSETGIFTVAFSTTMSESVVNGTMNYGALFTYNVRRHAPETVKPARRRLINAHLETADSLRLTELATWASETHKLRKALKDRLVRATFHRNIGSEATYEDIKAMHALVCRPQEYHKACHITRHKTPRMESLRVGTINVGGNQDTSAWVKVMVKHNIDVLFLNETGREATEKMRVDGYLLWTSETDKEAHDTCAAIKTARRKVEPAKAPPPRRDGTTQKATKRERNKEKRKERRKERKKEKNKDGTTRGEHTEVENAEVEHKEAEHAEDEHAEVDYGEGEDDEWDDGGGEHAGTKPPAGSEARTRIEETKPGHQGPPPVGDPPQPPPTTALSPPRARDCVVIQEVHDDAVPCFKEVDAMEIAGLSDDLPRPTTTKAPPPTPPSRTTPATSPPTTTPLAAATAATPTKDGESTKKNGRKYNGVGVLYKEELDDRLRVHPISSRIASVEIDMEQDIRGRQRKHTVTFPLSTHRMVH